MSRAKSKPKNYYFDIVCGDIATSSDSLDKICLARLKDDSSFPCKRTIFKWLQENQKFREDYELAKQMQVDAFIEEIIEIADDKSEDEIEDKDGNILLNKEFVLRSKVKIDARKWIAAKLRPKVFGDANAIKLAELEEKMQKLEAIYGKR